MSVVVALCRTGFEAEAANDLQAIGAAAQRSVEPRFSPGAAYVTADWSGDAGAFDRAIERHPPIFVRTVFIGDGPVVIGPAFAAARTLRADRVTPLLAAIDALARQRPHLAPWRSLWIEYADTNEGKALSTLARALEARMIPALAAGGRLAERAARRLHVVLEDGATAYVGTSAVDWGSRWPLGIPRMHMPGRAPSRATLKLAEAFLTFFGDDEPAVLEPGMRAVDLGAAPGGWSWYLAQRGLRVIAVDNAALKGDVAGDPRVTHLRADGLAYRPRRPVDWLVCDVVLQPSRIAELVARWIANGDARRAIFNLKLPMKRRFEEVAHCEALIVDALTARGVRFEYAFRQLYHDREEVTGYLARLD